MKALYSIFALLALSKSLCAFAEDQKPAPTMPEEVTLTSGRVLRNVQVVRWESERVVLKYTGGVDPIPFSLIKTPARADLLAIRAASKNAANSMPKPVASATDAGTFTVTGQAFDKGMDQPYRFVGMTVGLYPAGQEFEKMSLLTFNNPLPEPLGKTMTDIDGKFSLSGAVNGYILHARAVRSYKVGTRAVYEWTLRLDGTASVILNGENAKITPLVREF